MTFLQTTENRIDDTKALKRHEQHRNNEREIEFMGPDSAASGSIFFVTDEDQRTAKWDVAWLERHKKNTPLDYMP